MDFWVEKVRTDLNPVVSTLLSKEILGYVNVSASKKVFSLTEEESSLQAGEGPNFVLCVQRAPMFVD